MTDNGKTGRVYEYENSFFAQPIVYGDINLLQMGELCCECSFVINPHKQVCHEISIIVSGEGTFCVNDKSFKVKEGDVIINQMNDIHSIESSDSSRLRFLYLGFLFKEKTDAQMQSIRDFFSNPMTSYVSDDKFKIAEHMLLLMNEFYNKDEFSYQMAVAYITQILVRTHRAFNGDKKWSGMPVQPLQPNYAVNSTVYRTIKYIDDNIIHINSVSSLTRDLGYSYCYMSHVFKEKTGTTLQNYINHKKIQKSMELMDSGRYSITKIAEELNYASVQSFSKAFKRVLGYSPSAYRRKRTADEVE